VLFAGPMRRENQRPLIVRKTESPFIREFHMVQGTGFRCMAYRNGNGKWRGAFDHVELPGNVRRLD
jgi:hypothetical protein